MPRINKCKKCGELPFAEPVRENTFLISCCDQELMGAKANTVWRWNMANNPVNPTAEDRRVHAVNLVNELRVKDNFNEMWRLA